VGSRAGDRPSLGCLLYLAADQVMPRRGVTKVPCKQIRVDSRLWVTVVAATFLELRENGSIDLQLHQGQSYMQVILGARNASPQHGLPRIALRGLHDEAGSFGHASLPQVLSRISHDNGRALGYLASYVKQDVIWELVECGYYRATIFAGRSFCRPGLTASGSPRSMRYAQMPCASGSSLRAQSRSCVAIYLPTARSRSIHGLDGDEQHMNPLFEVEYRSWSRRTGAPEASATRRDRSPPVHGGYTRSRRVTERNGHERSPRELRTVAQPASAAATRHTFRRRARVRVSPPAAASPPGFYADQLVAP
jgi:hypothetical protein